MKKEFLPYYISRAVLSLVFALLVMGINWKAVVFATILFGLFLLYLHSGWFGIDLKHPLTPLRRDPRGQEIQRKALIAFIVMGVFIYLISSPMFRITGFSLSGNIALAVAILTYFTAQFILFARA